MRFDFDNDANSTVCFEGLELVDVLKTEPLHDRGTQSILVKIEKMQQLSTVLALKSKSKN